jgi:hypothetical protein
VLVLVLVLVLENACILARTSRTPPATSSKPRPRAVVGQTPYWSERASLGADDGRIPLGVGFEHEHEHEHRLRLSTSTGVYSLISYIPMSAQGMVKEGQWVTLRVEASLSSAGVYLDGQSVGTAALSTPGATRLTSHVFSSAGSAPTGSEFWIDEVRFVDE